ncbi:hypothetical protein H0A36_30670 [Endozoicomonas sp. SM1973]|uniref:Uncharacterized protein n=1 Tax=Spartinivicinus marinus TaxID=2994442 RepID=A0A853IBK7_9GAMM|nr:hypothetical protein [Spartinivicinus marinus]MCX4024736.1 hypothetical protein [Spartinivicinus marinus]MCX4025620.1 hypothetical protein [Spartinivicinus marinus]NYZ70379.1 hypothetical protein [Spartinivicinus marinus]
MTDDFTKTLVDYEELFRQINHPYNLIEHENGYFTMSYATAVGKESALEFRPDGSLIN